MKIKICGLFRSDDIDYVNEAKPDYAGFVFAQSKRQVNFDQTKQLKAKLDKQIKAVGVFVDSPIADIVDLVNQEVIEVVQLHGSEDNIYLQQLKQFIDVPIIKAIKVDHASDLDDLNYDVDYYLLDNKISGSGEVLTGR